MNAPKAKAKRSTPVWCCPACGAKANTHGRGTCGDLGSVDARGAPCRGFLCECGGGDGSYQKDHGLVGSNPCANATCYHCGWYGTMPLDAPRAAQAAAGEEVPPGPDLAALERQLTRMEGRLVDIERDLQGMRRELDTALRTLVPARQAK